MKDNGEERIDQFKTDTGNAVYGENQDNLKEINNAISEICESLCVLNPLFDKEKTMLLIKEYIKKYKRFVYSSITQFIYGMAKNRNLDGTLNSNLEKLREYLYSDQYINDTENFDDEWTIEKAQNIVLKLYDHITLAVFQVATLMTNDDDFKRVFDNCMIVEKQNFQKQLSNTEKEMSTQFIGLVAIFTALSFIIFGGLSSLDNIFDGLYNMPLLKLILIFCLWSFGIMNLLYMFMHFILLIIERNKQSISFGETNIDNKKTYKPINDIFANWIVLVSDVTICMVFLVCAWIYCVLNILQSEKKYVVINGDKITLICFGSFVVIIILIVCVCLVCRKLKEYKQTDRSELLNEKN